MSDFLDEIHQDIAEFAERHLEEEEREEFIDALLERKGYVRVSQWAPPADPAGGGRQGQSGLLRPKKAPAKKQQGYFKKS